VSDTEWVFGWNERYYRPNPDPVRRIVLRIVPDDDNRARQAAAGAFHITQVKPQQIDTLMANPDLMIYRFPSGAWRGMPQNLRRPLLQDARVRQAISFALDREAIVREAAMGAAVPAYLPVPPNAFVYDTSVFMPGRDVEQARMLLAEAGWAPGPDGMLQKNGRRFEYRIGIWKDEVFRRRAGELIKEQLAEVGIPVDLDLVDNARYQQIGDDMGSTHDTIIGGWSGLLDPDMNLSKKFATGGSQNYMRYSNARVDRLLEQGRMEQDPEKRRRIYVDLLILLYREAVFIPLIYPDYVFVVKKSVQGLKEGMTVDSWYHFTRNAYKWRLME
jgi:peptide/nickel transport system substrate-binding protein